MLSPNVFFLLSPIDIWTYTLVCRMCMQIVVYTYILVTLKIHNFHASEARAYSQSLVRGSCSPYPPISIYIYLVRQTSSYLLQTIMQIKYIYCDLLFKLTQIGVPYRTIRARLARATNGFVPANLKWTKKTRSKVSPSPSRVIREGQLSKRQWF